jgi:tetratricopeptide (TPR) repeat protein
MSRLVSRVELLYKALVTPKRLLLLALVLVAAYALMTQEKAEPPTASSCDQANNLYNQGAYGHALARFQALLKADTPPDCAAPGATAVGSFRCEQAATLHDEGLNDTAQTLYEKALLGDPGFDCLTAPHPPPSLPAATVVKGPKDTVSSTSEFFLAPMGRWLTRQVSWLELFILAALTVVLVIHLSILRRLRQSPTVEVGELTNATGDDDLDKSKEGLAMRLRVLLAEAGIPPPTVPGGGAQESAIAVIEASPLPEGKFLAPFFAFLLAQLTPGAGHKVAGTLVKRQDGQCGLTVVVTDVYEGRNETIDASWRDSYEEAAEIAAARVYERVTATLPKESAIPAYMRWTGPGDSMRRFFLGKEAEAVPDLDLALDYYQAAAKADPANALARMQKANVVTQQGKYLDALRTYLETVLFWPELYQARYRLAVLYSFVESWIEDWTDLPAADKAVLRNSIALAGSPPAGPVPSDPKAAIHWFLQTAIDQFNRTLQAIEKQKKTARRQRLWAMRPLYRVFIWRARLFPAKLEPIRELGRQRTMALAGRICTELQLNPDEFSGLEKTLKEKLDAKFNRWSGNWQAQYNAACFYTHAFKAKEDPTFLDLALDRLTRALNDPDGQLRSEWLCKDPDLAPLRDDERGAFLGDGCAENGETQEGARSMLRRLRIAWVLVFKASEQHQGEWTTRKADAQKWTGTQGRDLQTWAQQEADLWGRLVNMARQPENEDRQLELWKVLLKPDDEAKLPELKLPQDGPEGDEEEHRLAWGALATCAAQQRDRWDVAEDRIRASVMGSESPPSQDLVVALAEKSQEVWLALKDWAGGPLDPDARSDFLRRAGCEDPVGPYVAAYEIIFGG